MLKRVSLVCILFFVLPIALLAQRKEMMVSDIFRDNTFLSKEVPGFHFMKDGKSYARIDEHGNLIKCDMKSGGTKDTLLKSKDLITASGDTILLNLYKLSKDERRILIFTDVHPYHRTFFSAIPYVYNLKTKKLHEISDTPVLHATFSPDGTKVAYVRDNNLFYKNLLTGEEKQITFDGKKNKILNGNCDWVYTEELLFAKAFQWSPGSDQIAYYRFDERDIPQYTLPFYTDTSSYPTLYTYPYPKAGEPVPAVSIHVYDLGTGKKIKMDVGTNKDQYIPRIKWTTDDSILCIYRMNRLQNKLELLLSNAHSGNSHIIYTDTDKWYINIFLLDDLFFLKDGKHFIIVNDNDGWWHAYLYNMKGTELVKLTSGEWSIIQIAGIDEKNKRLYFTAAYPNPMNQELFVVNFKGTKLKQITHASGWHIATFNSNNTYFLDEYSTINEPPVYTIKDNGGKIIQQLENNSGLKETLDKYRLSKPQFLRVPNSDSVELNAYMIKPPHFDPTKKYPVLFMTYGGPGGNIVIDRWAGPVLLWKQLLAERGYIIFTMDNTGTALRGEKFEKKYTYLQLGWKEIHDQIDAAKWLRSNLSFIDSSRIGFWGWSFGGYMSSMAITLGSDVFHAAIAVAPVTNWKYYDNIYTERYMRTPEENPGGYKKCTPLRYADRLKGKFLLIQGTADDNVHFQNSIMLSKALIQDNKQFQQAYYPNKDHSISGGNTEMQLFTRMTDFILNNL